MEEEEESRGGKKGKEEWWWWVVGEGKVRESGKMENSAGWVENHRTSPVLRFGEPAGGRARFVLKSFYNSERAATWCLYHVFVSFYSFPLFSSLFFYSLRRVRCSRSLFLSLFVFDVSGIVGTTPVEAGVGSLRKEVLIVG